MSDIATKLKTLRKNKKASQEAVAEACGVARVTIARYENGLREPEPNVYPKLAAYYGVSTDFLMGIEEKKEKPVQEDERRAQIRELLDKMPEKDIEEVIRFMEFKLSQK